MGLVERREDENDRRVKLVTITKAGQDVADQHLEARRTALRAMVSRLSADEADRLHDALQPILAGDGLRRNHRRLLNDLPSATDRLTPKRSTPAVLKIAGVVVIGAIMSILDVTVVNVALPTFQKELSDGKPLTYPPLRGPSTAYTLAPATVIPLTGWAADRFGTKRLT